MSHESQTPVVSVPQFASDAQLCAWIVGIAAPSENTQVDYDPARPDPAAAAAAGTEKNITPAGGDPVMPPVAQVLAHE